MLFALLIMASAIFSKAFADKKETKPTKVVIKTPSDSVSYAAGKASTRGLMQFLEQQYQVSEAQMPDFLQGFEDAQAKMGDPGFNAYSAGQAIANMLSQRILPGAKAQFEGTKDSINNKIFVQGFVAALAKDNSIYTDDAAAKIYEDRAKAAKDAVEQAYKQENEAWLVANAKKNGVKTTTTGLQYKVITAGTGAIPTSTDEVTVKYEGKMIDGTVFDSSYKRSPQTSTFRCDQVIKGWTEALTMMPVGSKWELYIPQDLGYGERAAGQIKPYSTLIFSVELVSIATPKVAEPAQEATVEGATVAP